MYIRAIPKHKALGISYGGRLISEFWGRDTICLFYLKTQLAGYTLTFT